MAQSDYKLLDCGDFKKLEQIGPYRFCRPSPQAVWSVSSELSNWQDIHAQFIRKSDGNGYWKDQGSDLSESWNITHHGVQLEMRRTSFGHIGAFMEQGENWDEFRSLVNTHSGGEYRALNLFAYTGGATVACAQAGAHVTHVDASKTSVQWAKDNYALNGLEDTPARFITEDVMSFVDREIRRESKYEAIILDPPSFGRGTKKQVWKIEEHMVPLLEKLSQLASDNFHFISLSSHSQGYTPIALENLLGQLFKGQLKSREMTVPFESGLLPSGTTSICINL